MKYIKWFVVGCFCVVQLLACEKPEPITPNPIPPVVNPQDTLFEIIWTTRMDFQKGIVGSDQQQVYEDYFICFGDLSDPATIWGFNTQTGNKDWTYVYSGADQSNIDYNFRIDNILLCTTARRVFAFDLEAQSMIWEVDLRPQELFIGVGAITSNKLFYLNVDAGFASGNQVAQILEFQPKTGAYRVVFSEAQDSLGAKYISPPVYWYDNVNNRELLLFNNSPDGNAPPHQSTQDIMAIDLQTREVVWRVENFTESFASNGLHPPVIYKDIVITGGDWSIYAFDIRTGQKLWRYEQTNSNKLALWSTTNHLIHEDRLYVNESGFNITCLNPETGALIWNNPTAAPNCTDNMLYYEKEDLLVYTSWGLGSVMVLDALTGATIHREHNYDNSPYNNDVAYDPISDMFFTTTYKHAIGFKVRGL